ncbi:unnamed protein product [Ixodes hexagonus]
MGLLFTANRAYIRAYYLVLCLLAVGVSLVSSASGSTRCKNQSGGSVDWFILYKLPKMQKTKGNAFTPAGGEFVYIDSASPNATRTWPLSSQDLYRPPNPLAYTLAPLYQRNVPQDILYVVYNDQSPDRYNGTRNGHSKGVVMFDETVGIWLLHSAPRFVENLHGGNYTFPENARENAQIFLCVTLPTTQLNHIGRQLRMQYANVYDKGSPAQMRTRYPQMDLLFKDSFIRGRTMKLSILNVASLRGKRFLSVAKRSTLEVDIYSSVLTGQVKNDLVVQSWRNGAGAKLPNDCSSNYTVTDVDSVKLTLDQGRSITFNTSEDHSKWAIAVDKSTFCVGSMNRMESQFKRGGEALCFDNNLVNRMFMRSAIVNTGCPVRR